MNATSLDMEVQEYYILLCGMSQDTLIGTTFISSQLHLVLLTNLSPKSQPWSLTIKNFILFI
jgi:hypothetical protein